MEQFDISDIIGSRARLICTSEVQENDFARMIDFEHENEQTTSQKHDSSHERIDAKKIISTIPNTCNTLSMKPQQLSASDRSSRVTESPAQSSSLTQDPLFSNLAHTYYILNKQLGASILLSYSFLLSRC